MGERQRALHEYGTRVGACEPRNVPPPAAAAAAGEIHKTAVEAAARETVSENRSFQMFMNKSERQQCPPGKNLGRLREYINRFATLRSGAAAHRSDSTRELWRTE